MIHNTRTSARFAGLMVDPANPARMVAPPEEPAAAAAPAAPAEDALPAALAPAIVDVQPAAEPAEDDEEPPALQPPSGSDDESDDDVPAASNARGRGVGGRGRGRPRKAPAVPIATFSDGLPLMDFSLTVVSKGQHVPPLWLRIVYEFCLAYGERGLFALERGGNAEHLHVQGVVSFRSLTDVETCEKIKKMMKDALQVKRGDGKKWCVHARTPCSHLAPCL